MSDELRLEVTSEVGDSLETITEKDFMEAIKRMAVLVSNPMVHRNQMRDHRQGETEKVRAFVARVRKAAIECKFEVQCNETHAVKWCPIRRRSLGTSVWLGSGTKTLRPTFWPWSRGCQLWRLSLGRLRPRNRPRWPGQADEGDKTEGPGSCVGS